jgi:hypothetical protein
MFSLCNRCSTPIYGVNRRFGALLPIETHLLRQNPHKFQVTLRGHAPMTEHAEHVPALVVTPLLQSTLWPVPLHYVIG